MRAITTSGGCSEDVLVWENRDDAGGEGRRSSFAICSRAENALRLFGELVGLLVVFFFFKHTVRGQGYSVLKHIEACRWLFINYRWIRGVGLRARDTER